jgi:hypothetical protein
MNKALVKGGRAYFYNGGITLAAVQSHLPYNFIAYDTDEGIVIQGEDVENSSMSDHVVPTLASVWIKATII